MLEGLEKDAREGGKCLWADPHPVPPSEWRRRKVLRNPLGEFVGKTGGKDSIWSRDHELDVDLTAHLSCHRSALLLLWW